MGNLYIADSGNQRIRKVSTAGVINTVAGNGSEGYSGDGGVATSAQLNLPTGVTVDGNGNLYIADSGNHSIRRVSTAGVINTVAGNGGEGYSGDGGPATSAQLNFPTGIAADAVGDLYISESRSSRIRKVTTLGIINTVAGNGNQGYSGDGGPAIAAHLYAPTRVAQDITGNLYILDYRNSRIRKVTSAGVISTVAGNSISGYSGDSGPATSAQLDNPTAVAIDGLGNVYIAEDGNCVVRKVTPAGVISTVAGKGRIPAGETATGRAPVGGCADSGDGGPATSAYLFIPIGVAVDTAGNLYIAEPCTIRKVTADGVIRTIAGNGSCSFAADGGRAGDGGPATEAQIGYPHGIAVDAIGNVYISDGDRIRKVTPAGVISTVAGNGTYGFGGDGGPATAAQLNDPQGLAVDSAGNLFIADWLNQSIRKITPDGIITTVAGNGTPGAAPVISQLVNPVGVAVDSNGTLYILGGGPSFVPPSGEWIQKVTRDGVITTVAGTETFGSYGFSGDGGPASSGQINASKNIAVDMAGNLLIADTANHRIRKVTFTEQATFGILDLGGASLQSSGTLPATVTGYARIQASSGSSAPAGLAIFGFRQNNVLVTETGVPASPLIQSGRIYAEISDVIKTGLAMANPTSQPATVTFYFSDMSGNFGAGSTTIPANVQIARFLNEAPFNAPSSFTGTFTFTSSTPVAVTALRGRTNERSEFLVTALPVLDLKAALVTDSIIFPHLAHGGGWMTQIVLINPTETVLTGTLHSFDSSGVSTVTVAYSIPAHSSQRFDSPDSVVSVLTRSVRVIPDINAATPSGVALFSFRTGGITVSEMVVVATLAGTAFRLYSESGGDFGHRGIGSIQTGFAVASTSPNPATINLELTRLDGSSTGLMGTLAVPANGQTAVFLNQVQGFGSLQTPFQGVLRVSSTTPISITGLRARYNERGDFLMTMTPPVNEMTTPSTADVYFPQIVDSGGYTTQLVLISGQAGQTSSGTIQFVSQTGGALNITVR